MMMKMVILMLIMIVNVTDHGSDKDGDCIICTTLFFRITESSSWSQREECMERKRTATILTESNQTHRIFVFFLLLKLLCDWKSVLCWTSHQHTRIYSVDEVVPEISIYSVYLTPKNITQPLICVSHWRIMLTILLKSIFIQHGLNAAGTKSNQIISSEAWFHHILCHFCLILNGSYQRLAVLCDNKFPSQLLFGAVDTWHVSCLVLLPNTSNQENLLCIWGRQYVPAGNHQTRGRGTHCYHRQLLASHIHVPCWIHTNLFCFSC